MDASRDTAGQRPGSRRTSSASSMEFWSNTGMFFRTRLRKRNQKAVYRCSEAVSPSDTRDYREPMFTSRFAESRESGEATASAKVVRSLIAHGFVGDVDQGGHQ